MAIFFVLGLRTAFCDYDWNRANDRYYQSVA